MVTNDETEFSKPAQVLRGPWDSEERDEAGDDRDHAADDRDDDADDGDHAAETATWLAHSAMLPPTAETVPQRTGTGLANCAMWPRMTGTLLRRGVTERLREEAKVSPTQRALR